MVHLSAISYEGRVDVMTMVVTREVELSKLKGKIDEIQIRELIRWKMMVEANIKTWKEFVIKYPTLASPELHESWYLPIKCIVAANGRKTNKNIRSIEFPSSFMETLSTAISGAKKARMYRQVSDCK